MTNFCLEIDIEEIIQRLGPQITELAGKTVLLTGGRGFLGRYFTAVFERLNTSVLAEPVRVIVLDNLIVVLTYIF